MQVHSEALNSTTSLQANAKSKNNQNKKRNEKTFDKIQLPFSHDTKQGGMYF